MMSLIPKSKIQNPISIANSILEIERKFLLSGAPAVPPGAEIWRIEQGYLTESAPPVEMVTSQPQINGGRFRRTRLDDGSVICTHTIKTGSGVVRNEFETEISEEQFEHYWPRTMGRRLRKTRFRVRQLELIWEVDVFEDIDLVLAEIELPAADAPVIFPDWLRPRIVREVTDDPAYTNAAIAFHMTPRRPGPAA